MYSVVMPSLVAVQAMTTRATTRAACTASRVPPPSNLQVSNSALDESQIFSGLMHQAADLSTRHTAMCSLPLHITPLTAFSCLAYQPAVAALIQVGWLNEHCAA